MLRIVVIGFICIVLLVAATGYGLLAYKLELPPYHLAKSIYQKFGIPTPGAPFDHAIIDTDITSLLQIQGNEDVPIVRKKLRDVLWGANNYPANKIARVKENVRSNEIKNIRGLSRIDEYVLDMDFGLQATLQLFLPDSQKPSKLVIYHGAHGGRIVAARHHISPFLLEGYAVLGISMPLYDLNSRPIVDLPNIGRIKLATHNQFMYLTPENGIPVQYFVEPVVVGLNSLKESYEFECISMFGMSGGGWSSTIAAAVDDRIQNSYSVAGTTPIFIKGAQLDDYEQNTPALYRHVNHFDMYILASAGPSRIHFQIHNKYDPAYHRGRHSDVYGPIISSVIEKIGSGTFRVVLDDTHSSHSLSPAAFEIIFNDISSKDC